MLYDSSLASSHESLAWSEVSQPTIGLVGHCTSRSNARCRDSPLWTSEIGRSLTIECGPSITPCCGSFGVTIVDRGASWPVVFGGGLIQTAVGRVSGRGGPLTNRSG